MRVSGKLTRIQGDGHLGSIGNFQDQAAAEPIHLLLDLFRGAVGEVAGHSHEGRNRQEGCRQFQANPHSHTPGTRDLETLTGVAPLARHIHAANLAPRHTNCNPC